MTTKLSRLVCLLALGCTGTKGSPDPVDVTSCFALGSGDVDGDGLSVERERELGTDPCKADTDGDGFGDGYEVIDNSFDPEVNAFRYNPLIADLPSFALTIDAFPVIELRGTLSGSSETSWGITEEVSRSEGVSSVVSNTNTSSIERAAAVSRSTAFGRERTVEDSQTRETGSNWNVSATVETSVSLSGVEATASVTAGYGESHSESTTTATANSTTFSESEDVSVTDVTSYETSTSSESGRSAEWTSGSSSALTSSNAEGFSFEGGVLRVATTLTNVSHVGIQVNSVTLNAYDENDLAEARSPVGSLVKAPVGQLVEDGSIPIIFEIDDLTLAGTRQLLQDPFGLRFRLGSIDMTTDDGAGFAQRFSTVTSNTATVLVDFNIPNRPDSLRFQVATEVTDENGEARGLTVEELFRNVLHLDYEMAEEEVFNPYTLVSYGKARRLKSVNGLGTGLEPGRQWVVGLTMDHEPAYNFDELVLRKGDQLRLVLVEDLDNDGAGYLDEVRFGTDLYDPDSDDDGLTDGVEAMSTWTVWDGAKLVRVSSNPNFDDVDGDGLSDADERMRGTSPWSADSNADGIPDNLDWGSWNAVVAGRGGACGLGRSGDAECWASLSAGSRFSAPRVPFLSLSLHPTDGESGCGVDAIGVPRCWGRAQFDGQPSGPLATVSVGTSHACGLTPTGAIQCWGSDRFGQVSGAPTGTFIDVQVGGDLSCATSTGSAVTCWGFQAVARTPTAGTSWRSLAMSTDATCVLNQSGEPACFGSAELSAALADLGPINGLSALSVGGRAGAGAVACGTQRTGGIVCWGDLSIFQLDSLGGLLASVPGAADISVVAGGATSNDDTHAVGMFSALGVFTSISVGSDSVCALEDPQGQGRLACLPEALTYAVVDVAGDATAVGEPPPRTAWAVEALFDVVAP